MKPRTPARIRTAWILALSVDAIQIGLQATTGPVAFFANIPLDLAAMAAMMGILGWHWALLPSFAFELIPLVEVAPTWTLAVWIATGGKKEAGPR